MRTLAPLDDILRVRQPSPAVRLYQHARKLEIAREQGNTDEAIHEFTLMQRLYYEHFSTPMAERRKVHGFLSPGAAEQDQSKAEDSV
jgi:hypothetical protein